MSHVATLCPQCKAEVGPSLVPANFFVCPDCGLVGDVGKLKHEKRGKWAIAGGLPYGGGGPAPAARLTGAPDDNSKLATTYLLSPSTTGQGSCGLVTFAYDQNSTLNSITVDGVAPTLVSSTTGVTSVFNVYVAYNLAPIPHTVTASVSPAAAFGDLYMVEIKSAATGAPPQLDQWNLDNGVGTSPLSQPTAVTSQPNELVAGIICTEGPINDTAPTWSFGLSQLDRVGTAGGSHDLNVTVAIATSTVTSASNYTCGATNITSAAWIAWVGTFK